MMVVKRSELEVTKLLDRLIALSIEHRYNPYKEFDWPATLPQNEYWMSPHLLSVYGTPYIEQMSEAQLIALSKWESISFYSANVHGIRELLLSVMERIYSPGFERYSDYLSHFIGEENEHLWFFAQFCLRYGGKIYASKNLKFSRPAEPDIQALMSFAQILIFEEIGHYYNAHLKDDDRLSPIIRQINQRHYDDEARHIGMGREIVAELYARLQQSHPDDTIRQVKEHLKRYLQFSLESYYNPEAYRDAGVEKPYAWRSHLLQHPARRDYHATVSQRTLRFFEKSLSFK